MRVAVLSDIHGNLEALEAVLGEVAREGADAIVCLGDVVGYGPDPISCVEWAAREATVWVQGNHDRAALPEERPLRARFRPDARLALDWTERVLDGASLAALRLLPVIARGPWGLTAHATPADVMTYVHTVADAEVALFHASVQGFPEAASLPGVHLLWVGHTHLPFLVHRTSRPDGSGSVRGVGFSYDTSVMLDTGCWLVNPGSVGQPRDGDTRARWALLDTGTGSVVLRGTAYDYAATQAKMAKAGLPASIVELLGP